MDLLLPLKHMTTVVRPYFPAIVFIGSLLSALIARMNDVRALCTWWKELRQKNKAKKTSQCEFQERKVELFVPLQHEVQKFADPEVQVSKQQLKQDFEKWHLMLIFGFVMLTAVQLASARSDPNAQLKGILTASSIVVCLLMLLLIFEMESTTQQKTQNDC